MVHATFIVPKEGAYHQNKRNKYKNMKPMEDRKKRQTTLVAKE